MFLELKKSSPEFYRFFLTNRCIKRLFRFGHGEAGIENNERSEFFKRSESSAVAMTPRCIGKEAKDMYLRDLSNEVEII